MTIEELLLELNRIQTEAYDYNYHSVVVDVNLIREAIRKLNENREREGAE